MIKTEKDISLKSYNTFGIEVKADEFIEINDDIQIIELFEQNRLNNIFILGGGSNMLLMADLHKLILKINTKGKCIVSENDNTVIVKAKAGEDWTNFVLWTVDKNFWGLENLSKIPGSVGAAPIQNIGAYGVELKDSFYKLKAFEINTGKTKTFYKKDCDFAYRESIFKNVEKEKYIILDVYLELSKRENIKIDYGAIKYKLKERGINPPNAKDISTCITEIREEKLPNPSKIGNSGSFFKNPVISKHDFLRLKNKYKEIPHYNVDDGVKIPAAWMIDKAGWKGFKKNHAGVHINQPLVLVNYGKATGHDILGLARNIQKDVKDKFLVNLEIEVNIIGV